MQSKAVPSPPRVLPSSCVLAFALGWPLAGCVPAQSGAGFGDETATGSASIGADGTGGDSDDGADGLTGGDGAGSGAGPDGGPADGADDDEGTSDGADDTGGDDGPGPGPGPRVEYDCVREIHVAPNGSADNPGTPEQPRADVVTEAAAATAGDCVMVHPGVYSLANTLSFGSDGSAESPIVVWAVDGPGSATLDAAGHQSGPGVWLARSHVVLDGLEIVNMPTGIAESAIWVDGASGSTVGATVRNCTLTGGHNHLKINGAAEDVVFEYNDVSGDFGHIPISITGAVGLVLRGNYFHDWSPGGNGAIQIKGGSRDVVVDGNLFAAIDSAAGALALGDGCGSSCDIDPEHYAGRNNIATNNVFVAVGRALDMYGCLDCGFVHNTVVDSGDSSVLLKLGAAETGGVTRVTEGATIINNLIAHDGGGLSGLIQINDAADAGLVIDRNLVWNGGAPAPSWPDASGLTGDPLLEVGALGEVRPGVGSPAIDAGADSALTHDRDRSPRPVGAGPDIGAYEAQ